MDSDPPRLGIWRRLRPLALQNRPQIGEDRDNLDRFGGDKGRRNRGGLFGGGENCGVLFATGVVGGSAEDNQTSCESFITIVPSTLQLMAMVAQMLAISPALSLTSALAIPTMALVTVYLGKSLSSAELSAYLNEVLPSVLFVKASNTEWSESLRFNKLAHTDLTKRLRKRKMKVLLPDILQVMYFGALFVLCAGFMVLSPGTCDGSRLITFMSSLVFLVEPIQVKDKPDAINLDSVIGDVTFWDISFKYRDDLLGSCKCGIEFVTSYSQHDFPLILNGIDLHIRAGETVALVGPSGGGKTTLVKLLLCLYDPLCGCILIDGFHIQSIQLESLRKHVGLVTQDTILFSGTVAENIGYKVLMTGIDMERVKNAAAIANAEEFIIAKRQISVQGDEATSALDSQSELLVGRALEKVMENRTVLIIAHRLETVLMADRVFRLDGGTLQEIARSSLVDGHQDSLAAAGIVI
ncbi:ABC transporter B family member 29, chloroplastic-like protein [Drosera capensis]